MSKSRTIKHGVKICRSSYGHYITLRDGPVRASMRLESNRNVSLTITHHSECAVTVAGRLSPTASHDAAALSFGQLFGRAAALQICLSRVSWQSRVTHA